MEQVWVVEPENRTILVYQSETDVQKFTEGAQLTGEGILEGFVLDVGQVFAV